jgi:hypothetical protein
VVGHRPHRLGAGVEDDLRAVLSSLLACVQRTVEAQHRRQRALAASRRDCDVGEPPTLTAISPLAEGSDRLFAEAARDLGYALCCVMPFAQGEYERDFDSASRSRFRRLLRDFEPNAAGCDEGEAGAPASARTGEDGALGRVLGLSRLELDGSRDDPELAYGSAGRVVVHQSDLLVVVWDGLREGLLGGTEETFRDARQRGVPIVWVDALEPTRWQLVSPGDAWPDRRLEQRAVPRPGDSELDDLVSTVQRIIASRPARSR